MGDHSLEASGFLCVYTCAFQPLPDSKASRIKIVSDAAVVSPKSTTVPGMKQIASQERKE